MTARAASLLVASFCAAHAGCRFDTRGLSVGDGSRDAPATLDGPREAALLDARDGARGERQDREQSCLDGLDNDGDGMIDCADSDCTAGYECVPASPGSMSGYYRLRNGIWEEAAPACADGAKAGIYGSGPASASCGSCTCGPLTGAACGYPPIRHWQGGNEDCKSGTETDVTPTLGKPGCTTGTGSGKNAIKIVGDATLTSAGSCPASGGGLLNAKPWAGQLEVCAEAAVGGGCPSGVCVRRPAASYEAKICHRLTGGGDCGTWESVVGHADWKDGRACTPCACTPSSTKCSGGSYTFYGDNQTCDSGCNTPQEIKPGLDCQKLSPGGISVPYSVEAKLASPNGGACTQSGGQPLGGIQSKPVTFCCR